jgi:hypothetical protein
MFLSRLALIRSSWCIAIRHRFTPFFLTALIASVAPPCAAEESNVVPCDIKLVFGIDDNGMSEVSYDLEMQITNKEGRTIHGVSVHWLNAQSEIIGNSDAICGAQGAGIKLAQSGACRRTIQKIGGHFLKQLGQETWTSIINSEMYNFRAVAYCAIIGYRFGDAAVNRY